MGKVSDDTLLQMLHSVVELFEMLSSTQILPFARYAHTAKKMQKPGDAGHLQRELYVLYSRSKEIHTQFNA